MARRTSSPHPPAGYQADGDTYGRAVVLASYRLMYSAAVVMATYLPLEVFCGRAVVQTEMNHVDAYNHLRKQNVQHVLRGRGQFC